MNIIKRYVDNIVKNGQGVLTLRVSDSDLKSNTITVNGFKHSMVQVICFSIAYNIKIKIINAPNVIDVHIFCKLIKKLGGYARFFGQTLYIDPTKIENHKIDENLSKLIHGSLYLMPALLIRLGKFQFAGAGGCQIGDRKSRPYNHVLDIMKKFGANIIFEKDAIKGEISDLKTINNIDVLEFSTSSQQLEGPLVGGVTKTAILLSLNQEYIEILNPYMKTDVLDVLRFIQEIGKDVIIKKDKIIIKNSLNLNTNVVKFKLTQCVSEIMTYITFAVLNDVNVKIKNLDKERVKLGLKPEIKLLNQMDVELNWNKNILSISKKYPLKSQSIQVLPQTIQSDHHPFFSLMLTKADDKSVITEEVWKNRFNYVKNLNKFGLKLEHKDNMVLIKPCEFNKTTNVILNAKDVRTAAVTLLGAVSSHSDVYIENCEHLFRGYDSIMKNLRKFGAKIYLKENKNENSFNC